MRTAPFGGSLSRLQRLARPYLLALCIRLWAGNGGSMPPALPASVPIVSLPHPMMSLLIKYWIASAVGPGVCGPVSLALRNFASEPLRLYQSVRITTHSPGLMAPCLASHAL